MPFLAEVRRRKIVQVGATYGVIAWLAIQIAATVEAPLGLPAWFDTFVIVLLAIGFPVTLLVSWAFNFTADGIVRDTGGSARQPATGRGIELALIGLLIVAVGWLGYRDVIRSDDATGAGITGTSNTATPAPNPAGVAAPQPAEQDIERLAKSVAVLPCDNLSPDPNDAYFALGIHEEILNRLAKIGDMQVISRSSMMRYAADRPAIPEIARALRVETVMECTVRRAGDSVLVTAQLIDPSTDSHLWSDSYPGSLSDVSTVFALQADIAMHIANALDAEFSGVEQARIASQPTDSGEAYGLYLRALSEYEGLALSGRESAQPALDLIDAALDIDPEFAAAYGLRARIHVFLADYDTALVAATRAVELDPGSPLALWALMNIYSGSGRVEEARELTEQALEANPGNAFLLSNAALVATSAGEALRYIERAVTIDPASGELQQLAGMLNLRADNFAAAVAYLRESVRLQPASPTARLELARVLTRLGRNDEATESLRIGEAAAGPDMNLIGLSGYIYAYWLAGQPDDARRLFERFEARAATEDVPQFVDARAYLGVGEYDAALAALRRITDAESINAGTAGVYILGNYLDDPVLERPEFVEVRDSIRQRLNQAGSGAQE